MCGACVPTEQCGFTWRRQDGSRTWVRCQHEPGHQDRHQWEHVTGPTNRWGHTPREFSWVAVGWESNVTGQWA